MIQAIETRYKGYRFRSRLEARWGCFLDVLGLVWEYEKEGFVLGKHGTYLPDFWIEPWNAWLEIKPKRMRPHSSEWEKARALADQHSPVIVAQGNVGDEALVLFCNDIGDNSSGSSEWPADWSFAANGRALLFVETRRDLVDSDWESLSFISKRRRFLPALQSAYIAARSARFEHGERPQ